MTRSELCARVAARSSLSKADVAAAVGALTTSIADALVGCETVTVAGFGKFAATTRLPRGAILVLARPSPCPPHECRPSRPRRAFATHSTRSEPSLSVDSHPPLAAAARTRHGNAFATAPWRHAIAGTWQRPACFHTAPSHAADPLSPTSCTRSGSPDAVSGGDARQSHTRGRPKTPEAPRQRLQNPHRHAPLFGVAQMQSSRGNQRELAL